MSEQKGHKRSCPAYGNYQPPYEECDCGYEQPSAPPPPEAAGTAREESENAMCADPKPFQDSPLLQAKRRAFDNPTQANLDALIAAAKAEAPPLPSDAARLALADRLEELATSYERWEGLTCKSLEGRAIREVAAMLRASAPATPKPDPSCHACGGPIEIGEPVAVYHEGCDRGGDGMGRTKDVT